MSLVIEDYKQLSALTGQMRTAAADGEWDRLISLEQECRRKVEELKPRDGVLSDANERAQKIELIKKILADDADIRNRTEAWMHQLDRIMQSTRSEQRLQNSYLASY
ncbi:MAG TPA: flagellar protein FliT [Sideroxyarcus sp.]|nr:flagellar protein FliT [Sideroxyarcus sp.]